MGKEHANIYKRTLLNFKLMVIVHYADIENSLSAFKRNVYR